MEMMAPRERWQRGAVKAITAEGAGKTIGTLTFKDTGKGLKIVVDLSDLPPGEHGFHSSARSPRWAGTSLSLTRVPR
jgi:Cu/Zn superoxide dismutase